jgi:hypothetical protein
MPFLFAFAWFNALQAVRHSYSLSDSVLCQVTQAKQKLTPFLNIIWKVMISKGLNALLALSKFLVLLALLLSAIHAHAFRLVSGNQVGSII